MNVPIDLSNAVIQLDNLVAFHPVDRWRKVSEEPMPDRDAEIRVWCNRPMNTRTHVERTVIVWRKNKVQDTADGRILEAGDDFTHWRPAARGPID
jgi:hypothetical protein